MSTFFLILYVVLLVALVALSYVGNRATRPLKFILTALAIFVVSTISLSFESFKGWPAKADFIKGRLKGVEIINPGIDTNGHIYVWLYPDRKLQAVTWLSNFLYADTETAPLNYALPYSKNAAKKFETAKKALADGDVVDIQKDGIAGDGTGGGAKSKSGKGKGGKGLLQGDTDTSSGAQNDTPDEGEGYQFKITKPEDILSKGD